MSSIEEARTKAPPANPTGSSVVDKEELKWSQCEKQFDYKYYLKWHMIVHTKPEENELSCEECNKIFPNKYLLLS